MKKSRYMKSVALTAVFMLMTAMSFAQTVSAVSKSVDGATKAQADKLYKEEKYADATEIYESLLQTYGPSPEIYYNLGNCYYKQSNISLAILNYERALLLDPSDSQTKDNLTLARGKTVDKVPVPSEMFFVTWWKDFSYSMPQDTWALIAILLFAVALAGVLVYLFTTPLKMRKAGLYGAMIALFLCVVTNLAAYTNHNVSTKRNAAVIISSAVTVKSSPSHGSTDLFIIHEGTKVNILDNSIKGWREISYEDGKTGWIPTETMEVI